VGGISQGTGNTPIQNGLGGLVSRGELRPATTLKPERSKEFEAGLDLGFFKDRADASITWYSKKSSDIHPVAAAQSFHWVLPGGGERRLHAERGWEASLNVRPVQAADYGWEVGLQWARNRNVVLSLGGQQFISVGDFINRWRWSVSRSAPTSGPDSCVAASPMTPMWWTRWVPPSHILRRPAQGRAVHQRSAGLGANGYPLVDNDPRIVQDPNYDWTGSVRSSFRFRKLQIAGLIDIRHGGQIWNGTKGALWSYGTHKDTELRAACSNRNNPASCVGNEKTSDGRLVRRARGGSGRQHAGGHGEYWYRNVAACPSSASTSPASRTPAS